MAIKKLNKFFHDHSRIIFGVFAVLIILAFMPISGGGIGGCDDPREEVIGTAFGEKVTAGDLQEFYRNIFNYGLLKGQQIPQIETAMLFDFYCMTKRAEQLGLTVTGDDVAAEIADSPVFKKDGKFSKEAYDTFLQNHRMTDDDVEKAVSAMMLVNKLQQQLIDTISVTEDEAKLFYSMHKAGYEVDICSFAVSGFAVDTPADVELQAWYDARKGDFMTPGTVESIVAVIPYAKFLPQALAAVTAEDIAAAKSTMPDKSDDEIKNALALEKAKVLAGTEANRLGSALYNELDGSKTSAEQIQFFREWAAANGLTIEESGAVPFDNNSELSRRLQAMSLNGSRLVGELFPADNGIRIVMLKDRVAPRQMSFEEAGNLVVEACKAGKQTEKAREFIAAEIQKIKALAPEAQSAAFAAVAGSTHKTVKLPLTQEAVLQDFELFQWYNILPQLTMTMKTGDFSELIPMGDKIVVVRVISRTPADMSGFDAEKEMMINQLRMMKAQMLMEEFNAELKRQCQLTVMTGSAEGTSAE